MIEIANILGICRQTVSNTIKRFEETGNNENRSGSGRKRTARDEDTILSAQFQLAFDYSTTSCSTRKLAKKLNISQSSSQRILSGDLNCFPYKFKKWQELTDKHKDSRYQLSVELRHRFDNNMHRNVIFF